jgi:hypothetical protein
MIVIASVSRTNPAHFFGRLDCFVAPLLAMTEGCVEGLQKVSVIPAQAGIQLRFNSLHGS